jgi:hypothetical protein
MGQMFDTNPAASAVQNMSFDLPKSDQGASFGGQSGEVNTSDIVNAPSNEKAMRWSNRRGLGERIDPTQVGKGARDFGDKDTTFQPPTGIR